MTWSGTWNLLGRDLSPWRNPYGGMKVVCIARLKHFGAENAVGRGIVTDNGDEIDALR